MIQSLISSAYLHQFFISLNGNRLSQVPACRLVSNFYYGLCCIWTFLWTSVSTGFNPLYGLRNLNFCRFHQMEQLLLARTKKEFIYIVFLAQSSNFSCQTLGDCLCTFDAFHISNSIRYFWASVSLIPLSDKVVWALRGKPFQANNWRQHDVWIYTFELVIHLSKVNCWPFFIVSQVGRVSVKQLPAVSGIFLLTDLHSWKPRQQSAFLLELKRQTAAIYMTFEVTGHALQVWSLSFLVSRWGWNCAPNSGVEHVSRPEGCDLNAEGLWALSRILHALWMHHFIN